MSSATLPAVEGDAALAEAELANASLVRFLSAVAAATDGELLMALDCESGEPDFRQLEPDWRMVGPA